MSLEKAQERMKMSWHARVIDLFSGEHRMVTGRMSRAFHDSVSTLLANQVLPLSLSLPPISPSHLPLSSLPLTLSLSLSLPLSQVRSLLSSTMSDYSSLFSPEDTTRLPIFKLQLCLDDGAMQFFPSLGDLEAAVIFPLATLATDTLQNLPLLQAICYTCISVVFLKWILVQS